MKLSEEQYEIIEAYLTDELSATDRASFEDDMLDNPELRDEVERQRSIRLGFRALGIERALAQAKAHYNATLPVAETGQSVETIVRPLTTWRYWAVAASVLLLLGFGYYTYQQTSARQAELAYTETFAPDSGDQLMKDFPSGSVSADTRSRFLDALNSYKAGKYDDVIAQLATLPADKQTTYYKNYFLGLSYLANNQPSGAIPLLISAQATPSVKLQQKAEWFLALAYVKNKQKEKALPTLQRVSSDKENPFHELALRVLDKIE
ncbi:hypothetical protein IC229_01545 [Spirosoma sp. BT702]|uniref:Tetratricopeptide repeat protein n=1 Tax=Spirosoma profusum TaxID=2771354 RepID=A0A926XTW7_9BACT|nr:hypothetical protein [Spirosoma profusum]MBD2699301.1 hypothetical protein [Spirosoma profusum]